VGCGAGMRGGDVDARVRDVLQIAGVGGRWAALWCACVWIDVSCRCAPLCSTQPPPPPLPTPLRCATFSWRACAASRRAPRCAWPAAVPCASAPRPRTHEPCSIPARVDRLGGGEWPRVVAAAVGHHLTWPSCTVSPISARSASVVGWKNGSSGMTCQWENTSCGDVAAHGDGETE